MSLVRLVLPAVTLFAILACSAPAQTGVPAPSQATTAPSPRPAGGSPAPSGSPAAEPPGVTSDAEAVQEIQAVRDGYMRAQQALQAGRRDEALELMNTAYLDHFERIEPYLDGRFSRDYRQEVEASISRDLRRALRDGAPDAEVLGRFPAGFAKLAEAEQRLGGR